MNIWLLKYCLAYEYPFSMISQTRGSFCDCSLIQAIIFLCLSSPSIFPHLTVLLRTAAMLGPKGFSRHWEEFQLLEKC